MTAAWQPQAFPVQVASGFSPHLVRRSSGTACPNGPDGYLTGNVRQPGARPILYDAFDEIRDGGVAHRALDITCAEGSIIAATNAGQVPLTVTINGQRYPGAGTSEKGGNYVFVKQPDGFTTYYAHMLLPPEVSPGETVSANQILGYCGRTGNALPGCPHLHFALTDPSGQKVNPINALRPLYDAGGWQRKSSYGWVLWGIAGFAVAFLATRALASHKR